ncbi:MAG: methyltransferase domain-containing protein, partial [Acidothermales bacterium]|nr:methyltransferase domain-containing protein [Acidothermales bacterium]
MVDMLRELGSVTAIDDSEHAVEYCRRRHAGAVTVRTGRVPDDLRDGEVFDLVTAFDVVEHIEDDVAALRGLRAALVPGGRLVLTVPAYQLLWSQHDVNNGHYRRYRRAQLADALTRAGGLQIDRLAYFNSLLFPPAVAVRLFDRARQRVAPTTGNGVDAHLDTPPAPVNRVLLSVFGFEATLQRYVDPPFGVSLMALCRAV